MMIENQSLDHQVMQEEASIQFLDLEDVPESELKLTANYYHNCCRINVL